MGAGAGAGANAGAGAGVAAGAGAAIGQAETAVPAANAAVPSGPVQLTVSGAPEGALVKLGDRVLGEAPGPIALERGAAPLELTVSARGHEPRTFSLTPDRDATLEAPLQKLAARRKKVSRDLENPF